MKKILLLTFLILVIMIGCSVTSPVKQKNTPPPGWRSQVSSLLVDDSAFPEGWITEREFPATPDPTVNHVYRKWWWKAQGEGKADQAIWRSYTVKDAKKQFTELRQQGVLRADFTPSPWDLFLEFKPPPEITFRSQLADEFYLVCGWLYGAQCHVIARYRNYVTFLSLDVVGEYQGYTTIGLTYTEIEAVIRAMDVRFTEFLAAYPAPI